MRLLYLAKVVENEKYAKDVREGRLFFNRLSYYRKREDHSGRYDVSEGSILYQGDQVHVEVGGHVFGDDLISMSMQPNYYQNFLVFCMFVGHTGTFDHEIDEKYIARFRKQIGFPGKRLRREIGPFAIAFLDPNDLMSRIESAAKKEGFRVARSLVQYYDPDRDNVTGHPVFYKPKSYTYQQEYRVALYDSPNDDKDGSRILDVGDMRHNTIVIETEKFNSSLGMKDSSGNEIIPS